MRFACPSCGTQSSGEFCRKCGEKQITEQDFSMRRYARESLTAITLIESKLIRTLWLVVRRPGFLSTEYFKGRRVFYMKPVQLFVFLNVVYYFSLSLFQATTFTTPLATQLHMNDYYPSYASMRVDHKLRDERITYQTLESKYDKRTSVLSRTLIFLLIPIFAFLFYALFFRKRKRLMQHFVVATHFWSFNLMVLGVFLPLLVLALTRLVPAAILRSDAVLSVSLQLCFAAYLFLMLRRCYDITRWYGALTAAAIAWSFFHIVWIYRFLLFEATLWTV
jgi:hypothetical protein